MFPFEQSTEFTTVLAYDVGMLAHRCTCQIDANHPENPSRLVAIWQRIQVRQVLAFPLTLLLYLPIAISHTLTTRTHQTCLSYVALGILGKAAFYADVGGRDYCFLEISVN